MNPLRRALLPVGLCLLGTGLLPASTRASAKTGARASSQTGSQASVETQAPDQKTSAAPARTHRVLFALTSGEQADWILTLGNIRNLVADLKPDAVEIEVVAYGPGTAMVRRDSPVAGGIAALQSPKVRFVACENSMRVQGMTRADLAPQVGTVPAGIGEVVRREESGWSYVKAGR